MITKFEPDTDLLNNPKQSEEDIKDSEYVLVYGIAQTDDACLMEFFEFCYNASGMKDFIEEKIPEISSDYDSVMDNTDATFYAYAHFDEKGKPHLNFVIESEEADWNDLEVPLSFKETKLLAEMPEMKMLQKYLKDMENDMDKD